MNQGDDGQHRPSGELDLFLTGKRIRVTTVNRSTLVRVSDMNCVCQPVGV